MKQTLNGFVSNWNKSHAYFSFSVQETPVTGLPVGMEIRYSAARYGDFFSTKNWNKLQDVVKTNSHGTMYVVTDEYLFERGIVEIKIASSNHNYQERLVVGTVRWICEVFFPNEDKTKND